MRVADAFVVFCILVMAGAAGLLAYTEGGVAPPVALLVAVVVLGVLALVRLNALRARSVRTLDGRLDEITQQIGVLAGDFHTLERRLTALETALPRRAREELEPIAGEVEVLGTIVKQIAESVAELELREAQRLTEPTRSSSSAPRSAAAAEPAQRTAEVPAPEPRPTMRSEAAEQADRMMEIARAITEDRLDYMLQPIVSLPQRKARWYDVKVRARLSAEESVPLEDWGGLVEKAGLSATLDDRVIARAVPILRRLTARSREAGLVVPLAAATIAAPRFLDTILSLLGEHQGIADLLVPAVAQSGLRALDPIELDGLAALRDLGVHAMLDRVDDLRIDLRGLSGQGFRLARLGADRLLGEGRSLGGDIHPHDLADFFVRHGIDIVADGVSSDQQAAELAELDVRFGQGDIFSPPRPLRAEMLPAAPTSPASPAAPRTAPAPAAAAPALSPPVLGGGQGVGALARRSAPRAGT